jgi:hypothetical protein
MPQPRKYKSNAERQAAYRQRKASSETRSTTTTGKQELVNRVVRWDASMRKAEA